MRPKFFLLLAGLMALCAAAFAQPTGTIEGLVLLGDPMEGPAVGATVIALDNMRHDSLVTTTDEEGEFTFPDIMAGHWILLAHLEGAGNGFADVDVHPEEVVNVTIVLGNDDPLDDGSVEGTVTLPDGQVVPEAWVHLNGFRDNHHGHGEHYATFTDENGAFSFPAVRPGPYNISAGAPGQGFAVAQIEVLPNQPTVVDLVLGDNNGGGHHNDWDSIAVTGTVDIDTIMDDRGMVFIRYELDTDGDGEPNWVLDFGPPNYDPGNGATRPDDGDVVTITGMVRDNNPFGPDMIWVMTINGLFWREGPDGNGGGGGGHHGDSLEVVSLEGVAIVIQEDPARPARYFIDVDADGAADYRLCFGPPWYNPPGGAQRPNDGDEITIVGGLLAYGEPQMVVVYEINGMFWRQPGRGHGGHGGDGRGCNPDSLVRTEAAGSAIVRTNDGQHTHYFLDTDGNAEPNYILDFGRPDYDPGNGATRPEDGDEVFIVGGMFDCDRVPFPVIVVYEINGMFWRQPGDTVGLGAPLSVTDPVPLEVPATHLTASNYPNPFNPVTTIEYSIPAASLVTIRVFDLLGREVELLFDGFQSSGTYRLQWNAGDNATGIYFYEVRAGGQSFIQRMLLMK